MSSKNYLVWSEQRAKAIQTCERQYAYRYLVAWEGWLPDAVCEKQYAYYINSVITHLRIATGNIVHDRAGRVLQRLATDVGSTLAMEIAIAEEDFDKFLAESASISLTSLGGNRKKLLAHVYDEVLPTHFVASERASISVMLRTFFDLPEVALFSSNAKCLHREFIEARLGPPTNELDAPARLITDAVFIEDGVTVVCDWKTGKPRPEHRDKGIVYDIFVRARLRLSPDARVKVRFLYLRTGAREEFEFSQEERDEMRWRVGEEFEEMRMKSADPVINVADKASFRPLTGFHCLGCAHQLICPDFSRALTRGQFDEFLKHGGNL